MLIARGVEEEPSPIGQTLVLREQLSRDHLSAISAITEEGKLYMPQKEGASEGADVIRYLNAWCELSV